MIKYIAIGLIALSLAACTDEPNAIRALQAQGYKDIVMTGYDAWGCGKDDNYSTGFTATTQNGTKITGVFCSGVFKGGTIRTY